MARPRKNADETPLFVRIPSAEAAKLHHASSVLGAPKRELPGRKIGEEWRFSREAVLAWLAEEE